METLRLILLFLHLLGMAALLGGFAAQLGSSERRMTLVMLHGAFTQLVTGIALVGVREADDLAVDNAKIGVKLVVAAVIAAVVWLTREQRPAQTKAFGAVGLLTVANVGVAVFWT